MRRRMTDAAKDYEEDEDHWYFGALVYYNPNDRHFMVETKVGMGITINMGSIGGKVTAILTAALLLFCILGIPVIMGLDEFTPVGLRIENGTLEAVHTGVEYQIPEQKIAKIRLLDTLPEVKRKFGTGLENLSKGVYKVRENQTGYLCLNPENGAFLELETTDGDLYLFSDATDAGTRSIYDELKRQLKEENK